MRSLQGIEDLYELNPANSNKFCADVPFCTGFELRQGGAFAKWNPVFE